MAVMSGRGFDRSIGRVLGVLLVAGGFVRLPAQEEELWGRLLLAARGATTDTDLQSLCDATEIDELLTVVAEHQAELSYWGAWSNVEQALAARQPDIERAWGERPERRSAWARGLAHSRWFWSAVVPMHSNADARERADLEQVAQHAPPVLLERWLRTPSDRLRASGHALYRAAVAGQAAHADDCTAVARVRSAFLVRAHVWNGFPRLSPFVLRDALFDGDAHVRARACWALRRLMKWEPPAEVSRLLGSEIEPPPRLNDEVARRLLRELQAGTLTVLVPGFESPAVLSKPVRRELARALIAAAARVPVVDGSGRAQGTLKELVRRQRDNAAVQWFAAAARLHPEEFMAVLAFAVNAESPAVTARALRGLISLDRMPPEVAGRSSGVVRALLDHENAGVAVAAAELASRALAIDDDPALRRRLSEIAVGALEHEPGELAFAATLAFCGVGPPPVGPPANLASQAVYALARLRPRAIGAPLVDALTRGLARQGARRGVENRSYESRFLLDCAAQAAPSLSPEDAKRLHGLVMPRVRAGEARAEHDYDPELELAKAAMRGLFVSVPPELLSSYDAMLAEPNARRAMLRDLGTLDEVPADRARYVLDAGRDQAALAAVGLFAPKELAAEWRAGGERRRTAVVALRHRGRGRSDRLVTLAEGGVLPREFVVAALDDDVRSLPQLAALLPTSLTTVELWGRHLAKQIARARPSSAAADLEALRVLGVSPVLDVGLAVIRRAGKLGDAGRTLAAEVVERQTAQVDVRELTAVVRCALEQNLPLPDLPLLLQRLRNDGSPARGEARRVANAAELRARPKERLHARIPPTPHEIALAGIDVDAPTLRQIYPNLRVEWLRRLLSGSNATRCSALTIAGEFAVWPERLEQGIVRQTSHVDADVRLAAYRALATRDSRLWLCGLLVHEGAFDPDPRIRTLAHEQRR